jgi:hypothetical protein
LWTATCCVTWHVHTTHPSVTLSTPLSASIDPMRSRACLHRSGIFKTEKVPAFVGISGAVRNTTP